MVEVVGGRGEGASPPKPIPGSKRSCPEKKKKKRRRWERRVVVVGWEGLENEPSQADARVVEVMTGMEHNHRSRW